MPRGSITASRVKRLKSEHHVVIVHPRKKTVIVDGFKIYSISKKELGKL